MFDRIKFLSSALIGLALGILLALPLFWIGVKSSVGAMQHNSEEAFQAVEKRQQAMADECLRFEKTLTARGWKKNHADFVKVELLRSRLAGYGDLEDKIEISQDLERALLNIESIGKKAIAGNQVIHDSAFVREFYLNWQPAKRYLVDEQMNFTAKVKYYNATIKTWPVPAIVGHKSFADFTKAVIVESVQNIGLYFRTGFAWARYVVEWCYAKLRGHLLPTAPEPLPRAKATAEAVYVALPEPYYIAEAPIPEEDYKEIQYNREQPNMADVEVGEDKAVLEGEYRKPYSVPVPTIQRTATYK